MEGKKILLVDDEPDIVRSIENKLKANGYNVITASDGLEALDKAHRETPDLIILDIMLPKMDGHKICALLKKDGRYAKIPIIIYTVRDNVSDRQIGEEVGADAYIAKLFNLEELVSKVKELLGSR